MLYRVLAEFRGETVDRNTQCGRLGIKIHNNIVTTKCYYIVVTGYRVANGVLDNIVVVVVVVVVGNNISNDRSSVRKLVNGGDATVVKTLSPSTTTTMTTTVF